MREVGSHCCSLHPTPGVSLYRDGGGDSSAHSRARLRASSGLPRTTRWAVVSHLRMKEASTGWDHGRAGVGVIFWVTCPNLDFLWAAWAQPQGQA